MSTKERIEVRYKREVIAHPEGAVVHHGDCYIYRIGICNCGLIHDLLPIGPEKAKEIYYKFEEDFTKQENSIDRLEELQRNDEEN